MLQIVGRITAKAALSAAAMVSLASCGNGSETYTLYRSSALQPNARIHVATFDADESEAYNSENCRTAVSLFSEQPGILVRYWCEKGEYRR